MEMRRERRWYALPPVWRTGGAIAQVLRDTCMLRVPATSETTAG
jgi:hypothetical protein